MVAMTRYSALAKDLKTFTYFSNFRNTRELPIKMPKSIIECLVLLHKIYLESMMASNFNNKVVRGNNP